MGNVEKLTIENMPLEFYRCTETEIHLGVMAPNCNVGLRFKNTIATLRLNLHLRDI